MQASQLVNTVEIILQSGFISVLVVMVLLTMSLLSWYYIVTKAYQSYLIKTRLRRYLNDFWKKPTLQVALQMQETRTPAYRVLITAVESAQHHQQHVAESLGAACSQDEFIARSLRRTISQEQAHLESGLSILATVGSIAPFVGLLGTVWGIYHALAAIGISGQASIDKVAGPVGEALIMTAVGLAVAIPAVIAYNTYIKVNRNIMAELENFAQDLHILITTGAPLVIKQVKKSKGSVTAFKRNPEAGVGVENGVTA